MELVLSLLIVIVFSLVGLAVWTSSDRPLALREIALNTRRNGAAGPDYVYLKVLSVLLRVFAVLVWNTGLFLVIVVNLVRLPRLF